MQRLVFVVALISAVSVVYINYYLHKFNYRFCYTNARSEIW